MWISLRTPLLLKICNTSTQLTVLPSQLYSSCFLHLGRAFWWSNSSADFLFFFPFWWSLSQEGSVAAALSLGRSYPEHMWTALLRLPIPYTERWTVPHTHLQSWGFVLPISSFLNSCHLPKTQSELFWATYFIWLEDQGQIVKSSITLQFN